MRKRRTRSVSTSSQILCGNTSARPCSTTRIGDHHAARERSCCIVSGFVDARADPEGSAYTNADAKASAYTNADAEGSAYTNADAEGSAYTNADAKASAYTNADVEASAYTNAVSTAAQT